MKRFFVWGIALLVAVMAIGLGAFELRHREGVERANQAFSSYRPPRLGRLVESV